MVAAFARGYNERKRPISLVFSVCCDVVWCFVMFGIEFAVS